MGRNQQRHAAGLTPASGLTAEEQAELDRLEKWINEKEYRQGSIGYTVHHARRDALRRKRDGAVVSIPTVTEEVETNDTTS